MFVLKGFLFALIASAESECSVTDPDGDLCLLQLKNTDENEKVELKQADEVEVEEEELEATAAPDFMSDFVECPTKAGKKVNPQYRPVDRVACPGEENGYAVQSMWPSTDPNAVRAPNAPRLDYVPNGCQNVEDADHCQQLCLSVGAPVSVFRNSGGHNNGNNHACACHSQMPDDHLKDGSDFTVRVCPT